jgi:all-trans-retinol 13,14-reductase
MNAILVKHYLSGGYFPIGGSEKIGATIERVIENGGGTVLVNAEVKQLIIESGKVIGVLMADDRKIMAKTVVSSIGIPNTINKLLPDDLPYKQKLADSISGIKYSASHCCLYLGLDGTPEELSLPKANYWIYPREGSHDENVERFKNNTDSEFALVYISFPAAKDPDWKNRYPGKSTIDIVTSIPFEVFKPWENTEWKKRGKDYEQLKEKISQRLLEELYKLEPQLRGKVDYYELSTPLSTKKFVNYDHGEIYGLEHTPARFENKFLRPHTGIKNFYLSGQDISTAGVIGAMAGGMLTASAILNKNLFKKILT